MLLNVLILIAGFLVLIKGAGYLVTGSSSLAKRMGISGLVIGLTVVAFGTSAPELAVNLFSASKGATDIAIGNILGSNLANILLVLGASALFTTIAVQRSTVWKEIPFSMLAVLALFVAASDSIIDFAPQSILSRIDGILLLLFFVIFIYYTLSIARAGVEGEVIVKNIKPKKIALFIIGGALGLVLGGKLIADSAIYLAAGFGLSEGLVGMTIVALGTSLPELATSLVAAYRKQVDMAVGNVIGSNIFNILLVLGVTSTFFPLPFTAANQMDLLMVVSVTLILFVLMFIGQRHRLTKKEGILFLIMYFAYIGYLIWRG